jgi:hypothetical protein
MTMLFPAEVITDIFAGSRPTQNMAFMRSAHTGWIREVHLWVSGSFVAQWWWNLVLNGVRQWSGTDRLVISPGNTYASKTGLSIPVTFADQIRLDVEIAGSGKLGSPYLLVVFEED